MEAANNKNTTYTLIYNPNGGEGGPSTATLMGNEYYAIFHTDTATPIRENYDFAGWSFTPDGPAEVFAGDFFTVTSQNSTLYAVWVLHESNVVSTDEETEANAQPLGVITSSDSSPTPVISTGILAPTLLGVIVASIIVISVTKARRPHILSKEYDDSTDDFNLDF